MLVAEERSAWCIGEMLAATTKHGRQARKLQVDGAVAANKEARAGAIRFLIRMQNKAAHRICTASRPAEAHYLYMDTLRRDGPGVLDVRDTQRKIYY